MLVQDVIDEIKKKQFDIWDPDKIRSVKTQLKFSENSSEETRFWIDGSSYFEAFCDSLVEDAISATASIQYKQTVEQSSLDQWGLTPRHLPEICWELTRLSYVVDWIFTIGPWLGTLRYKPSIQILGNTTGIKVERTMKCQAKRARYSTGPFSKWEYEAIATSSTYERQCHTDLSFLPHFTWGRTLDLFKAVDALSLIWQNLPKKRK
jgi:hypothetical protein